MKGKWISDVKASRFFLGKMWGCSKGYFVVRCVASFLQAGGVYASVLLPGMMMDALEPGEFPKAFFYAGLLGVTLFATGLLDRWSGVYCRKKAAEFEEVLTLELAETAAEIPYSDLETFSVREQYERAGKCISRNAVSTMMQSLLNLPSIALALSGILFIVSYLSWWLWAVLLAGVALEAVCQVVRMNYNYASYEEQNAVEMNMCYYRDWMPHRDYAKEVRLYRMVPYIRERVHYWMDRLAAIQRERASKTFRALWWSHLVDGVVIFAIYSYIGSLCLRQVLDVGSFLVSVAAVFQLNRLGVELANVFLSIVEEGSYLQAFRGFLGRKARQGTFEGAGAGRPEFVFEGVSFRYEGTARDAVSGLDLAIKPGRHYGIVGPNGAGKTTFVKLLMGLYEPSDGGIRCGGVDVREWKKESYWELFSAVFQDYNTFGFRVDENIAAQREPARERCREAAEKAGILDKILSLPEQFGTFLDREYHEDGVEFSQGEQQKLALARMIYKDAPVWVLDEPTAALSPKSELELYEQLGRLTKGRTVLFISHRLASCRLCDEILVFDGNRLAARGTHEELMEAGGLYREMFETQAKYYDRDYREEDWEREGAEDEKIST